MKKQLLNILFCGLLLVPFETVWAQSTVDAGQTTEGKDFWVTFLKTDSYDSADKSIELSLSISAQEACDVTIENTYSGFKKTISLAAGELKEEILYKGTAKSGASTKDTVKCYSMHSEVVDTTAIHITSTANISLFASNWKTKSFDATNVLPTQSLLDEYYIQSYPPSAHGGDTQQGTHFAIVAAEDDVVVDITPTVKTFNGKPAGETFATDKLQKGQVYYVWTGTGGGDDYDLSGTHVKARDGKRIAVFQGAPHTNIPYQIRDRDHIFSQAMPVKYWGNTFAITSSMTRGRDKVRIMALHDETEVRINGELVYTFHFDTDDTPSGAKVVQCAPKDKRTFEFEIGAKGVSCTDKDQKFSLADPLVEGTSCFIETSCPVAVHLFMVSNTYDNTDKADPAMLWINPIEQVIENITFATYKSSNTHYYNVVTTKDNINDMYLDNNLLSGFTAVDGSNDAYYYLRQNISHGTHTLAGKKGFIAHVYGYGERESYGYSAGGATRPLTQYITINGEIFTPDTKNTLCGVDTIQFECHPDYEYTQIEWHFGDGESTIMTQAEAEADPVVPHYYPVSGTYEAYVLIYRESSNLCAGYKAVDSIPISVTTGRYEFTLGELDLPCPAVGEPYLGYIPYTNAGEVDLKGDNVTIQFDEAAIRAGFDNKQLIVTDDYFQITVPENDKVSSDSIYGLHLTVTSDCGGTDTTMTFRLSYDKDVIVQRQDNVLGLSKKAFEGKELSNFQWFRASDSTAVAGATKPVLNFYDLPKEEFANEAYYVCFDITDDNTDDYTCTCARAFAKQGNAGADDIIDMNFEGDSTMVINASYIIDGQVIFVNADWKGQTDIECYAQWVDVSGNVLNGQKHNIPDGGCTIPVPGENGFYILRVVTDGDKRSFKFIINH